MLIHFEGDGALYQRLYRGLRAAILDGRLPPRVRLPSTRSLASEMRVSRNVVVAAFAQLLGEGYIEGRVGSGTYVSATLPDSAVAALHRCTSTGSRQAARSLDPQDVVIPWSLHPASHERGERRIDRVSRQGRRATTSSAARATPSRVPELDPPTPVHGRLETCVRIQITTPAP
jgi:DNA-binding transcriptional MocR family regulator